MTEFVRTAAMHVLEIDAEDRDDYINGLHESWVSIGLQSGMDDAATHENADLWPTAPVKWYPRSKRAEAQAVAPPEPG